jgi:hypothetical protein
VLGATAGVVYLAGVIAAASTAGGSLTLDHSLAGEISASSSISGSLEKLGSNDIAGEIAAVSEITGSMSALKSLAGDIVAVSTVAGALEVEVQGENEIAGTIAATSSIAGGVSASKPLAGDIGATSALVGAASATKPMGGTIAASSTVAGSASAAKGLGGTIVASSVITGALTNTAADPVVAFIASTNSTTDASSYSFPSVSIGAASSARMVVVQVAARAGSFTTLAATAVTIAGVTASQVVGVTPIDGANSGYIGLWAASVASGTTGTIAITLNTTVARCAISVFTVLNTTTTTATKTFADGSTNNTVSPLDVNVGAKSVVIAAATWASNSMTGTWSGASEVLDDPIGLEPQHITAATYTSTSAENPHAIGITISGSSGGRGGVAASFG